MGQYHRLVNLDRKEFIDCHALGDGLKLSEQVSSGAGGVASALLVLLAASNGRGGGGDLVEDNAGEKDRVVGRWAGQRIAMVGDYAEDEDYPVKKGDPAPSKVYVLCVPAGDDQRPRGRFKDITPSVRTYMERLEWAYVGKGWVRRIDLWRDITGIECTHGNTPGRRTVVGRVGTATRSFWQDEVMAAVAKLPYDTKFPVSLEQVVREFGIQPVKEDR